MRSMPDAIVLCGGAGTRLTSITAGQPKSMASIGGRPFLELLLRQLRRHNFRRVILAVGFRREVIQQWFGSSWLGMELKYSIEEQPLGTGGALGNTAALIRSELCLGRAERRQLHRRRPGGIRGETRRKSRRGFVVADAGGWAQRSRLSAGG